MPSRGSVRWGGGGRGEGLGGEVSEPLFGKFARYRKNTSQPAAASLASCIQVRLVIMLVNRQTLEAYFTLSRLLNFVAAPHNLARYKNQKVSCVATFGSGIKVNPTCCRQ